MIAQIANVTIDGINTIFGGYIYALDYQQSFGEAPSQLKVTITNATGVFNIDPSDLDLLNHTYTIQIGNNITLYMLLIEYEFENRPTGKLLQLSFVDSSIQILDHIVVKLLRRQFYYGPDQYTVEIPGYYPSINTIIIGEERQKIEWFGPGVAAQIGAANSNLLFTIGTPGVDFNPAKVRVVDIQYTFPQLLNILIPFINPNSFPSFDYAALTYFNSYAGRLREVLSAWCNDLGFGFYWENNQLNFIDLTSVSTTSTVVNYANAVFNANVVLDNTQKYSLRDTMSRGVYSFFGKDAKQAVDLPPTFKQIYPFICMTVNNIPWSPTINVTVNQTIVNPFYNIGQNVDQGNYNPFLQEVKASYYGEDALLLSQICTNIDNDNNFGVQNIGDTAAWYRTSSPPDSSDQSNINFATANTPYAFPVNLQYNWFFVMMPNQQYWDAVYKTRRALAEFWGSFFFLEIDSDTAKSLNFDYKYEWYAAGTPLPNVTILNDTIAPLAPFIQNYQTLSLQGFINNDPFDTADVQTYNYDFNGNVLSIDPPGSTDGYAIIKINPVGQTDPDGTQRMGWRPTYDQSSTNLVSINSTVIIEGDVNNTNFQWEGASTTLIPSGTPGFWLGIVAQNFNQSNGSSATQAFNNIQLPSENNINVFAKNDANRINASLFFPRIQFEGYVPPATSNVNLYDINFVNITEDQIASIDDTQIAAATIGLTTASNNKPSLQQNPDFIEWSNAYRNDQEAFMGVYAQALTLANFNTTFELFGVALTIDQAGPFFNSVITVPNIDLNIPNGFSALSVSLGLQSFTITVDDKGMKTTYSIGTLKMKLRSPNVFFRYRYDDIVGNYQLVEFPSTHLLNSQF